MLKLIHLKEGLRMFRRAMHIKKHGTKQYGGNAEQICRQIVGNCWNGKYFQTSAGHFCEFWTRDFGFCIDSLIRLGYRREARKTLKYALDIFRKQNKITTTISPENIAFDFPYYASDSIPFLVRSLRVLGDKNLISDYRDFLNREIKKYCKVVIDAKTGLVIKDRAFSSIKDYSIRKSSCYDNCMAAMLALELNKIKILENPFKKYNYKKLIKENFWKKTHFVDDLSGRDSVTGDANIFPFWCGIFDDKKMLMLAIHKIQECGLDRPFPLRYYHSKTNRYDMIFIEIFTKDYERDTVWMHMGPLYASLVRRVDKHKADYYMNQYKELIEKHKNYFEVFNSDGTPYGTAFYYADESMLWACNVI